MKQQERYIEYDERIDRYLRNQMGDDERVAFEQDVEQDQELRERLVATSLLVQGIAEEGMHREGQYQLDTISQMSPEEFLEATSSADDDKPKGKVLKWAAAVATLAIGAGSLLYPVMSRAPLVAKNDTKIEKPASPTKTIPTVPDRPTLASLAKEYNRPIAGEPDEFVAIRKQIQSGNSKEEMMAIVYDIDKIKAPEYVEGAMGAENAEVVKEMQQIYTDCTRWYKALAYLKANDKSSAISELNELIKHSSNEDMVNCASALHKKLK